MNIRNRIALQFSLIVASVLLVFSLLIYVRTATARQQQFTERLRQKALTTVRLLFEVKEVDRQLLKIIDRNTLTALYDEKVLIFDERNQLIYSSVDDHVIRYEPQLLQQIRARGEIVRTNNHLQLVGLLHRRGPQALVVLASAYDKYGQNELSILRRTLLWVLLGGIGTTVALGIFFAGQSLRPIGRFNETIRTLSAQDLKQRLDEGRRQDEIDQLAVNFNALLDRLEAAFAQQRSFVSHASHELRTPLAALKSEIQLGLNRSRSVAEHEQILHNLLGDADRLIALTNSLLFLARTLEAVEQVARTPLRLEEVLFEARDDVVGGRPSYRIDVAYDHVPTRDEDTLVLGNADLLRRVFYNLFDNACKYSADQTATVRIRTDALHCYVTVSDQGIGIPPDDLPRIFEPFMRAANVVEYEGFGIGLSICHRIISLYGGERTAVSSLGAGSQFTVRLAHL